MALSYLRERGDCKWLLHLGFYRPHPPFIAPDPYHSLYDPDEIPGPMRAPSWRDEAAQHPLLANALEGTSVSDFIRGADGSVRDLSEEQVRAIRVSYFGLMSEVDHQLGRVFSYLEEQSLWDETFRIPLIIRQPGDTADSSRGDVVDHFTEAIDIMPTVLDWVGADIPRTCDGASLLPLLMTAAGGYGRDAVHFEFDNIVGDEHALATALECSQAMLSGRLAAAERTLTGYRASPEHGVIEMP